MDGEYVTGEPKRAVGGSDWAALFDEKPDYIWCLHCGRVYRWGEWRHVDGITLCHYEGCDGDLVFDGWPWEEVRKENADYPHTPKRGHVYELNRKPGNVAEEFERFQRVSKYSGGLLPQSQAAVVLGLSKQRVNALVAAGALHEHGFFGKNFIAAADIAKFQAKERRNGRPKGSGKKWRNSPP